MPTTRSSTTFDQDSSRTERRPAHNAGGRLSTTVQTSSRTSDEFRTQHHPAHNAGGSLSTQVRRLFSASRTDIATTTDAHFFYSSAAPPVPAHNAGGRTLAHSSSHASVNCHLLRPARTEAQNESRPSEGADTYEARTLEIMQYIWDLSDNCDRLQDLVPSMQPHPEDRDQRLRQLYASIRNIEEELRHDITQYTLAMGDWDVLNTEYLSEDNEWSRRMLQHRQTFFKDPAFESQLLDEKQMELRAYYCSLLKYIEDILQYREHAAKESSGHLPPHKAGGPRTPTGIETQCAALRLGPQQTPPNNTFGAPPPTRTGWSTARGSACKSSQRPAAHNAVGVAPPKGPAAHNAAGNLRGTERKADTVPPARPSQEALKTLMSNYTAVGPKLSYSGPLQVGADGKPFSSSSNAAAAQPPSSARTDQCTVTMADTHDVVVQCPLCGGPHCPSQCTRYDNQRKRLRRLYQLKYCLLCLRGDHPARMCPTKTGTPCIHCGHGEHHPCICMTLHDHRKKLQPSPMSAKKKELATRNVEHGAPSAASPGVKNGTSSSPSRFVRQATSSVTWAPQLFGSSTVPSRTPSTQISPLHGVDNSTTNRNGKSKGSRTRPKGRAGTTQPPTNHADESVTSKDAPDSGPAEFLLKQKSLRVTDRRSKQDETVQFDRQHGDGSYS